jgi:hypothetical protein
MMAMRKAMNDGEGTWGEATEQLTGGLDRSPARQDSSTAEAAPKYVVVAAYPRGPKDNREFVFPTALLESGKEVVLAYSTGAGLVAALGEFQPWSVFKLDALVKLAKANDSCVGLDLDVPSEFKRWDRNDLANLARTLRGEVQP